MPGNIAQPPPDVVAAWPSPNYDQGIRRQWLPAFAGVWLLFSSLLVFVRSCLRLKAHGGGLGLDDVCALPHVLKQRTHNCLGFLGAILGFERCLRSCGHSPCNSRTY